MFSDSPTALPAIATLLAIDTATEYCAVALMRGGDVVQHDIVQHVEAVGQSHSTVLLPWIETLLHEQHLRLSDCDAIAFGAGPGGFTGLRIACGVAQGLAWGAEKPVIPVGNLAALAWLAAQESKDATQPQRIACAIDARMQEVYWAVFDVDVRGNAVHEVVAPSLSAAHALTEELRPYAPQVVAGNAFLEGTALTAQCLPQVRADARAIAVLAQQAWLRGEALPAAQARPLYVRDRVAQTIEERKRARTTTTTTAQPSI